MSTCRRMKRDSYLSPCTKLKSKWIKDLNIKLNTLNLIEYMGTGDHFLCITLVAKTIRATLNKWNLLKLRSLCKSKDTVIKTRRQPTDWEKMFTIPASDKDLISKIYKLLKKLDFKMLINPIKNWSTNWTENSQQKKFKWPKTLKVMFNLLRDQV